MSEVIAEDLLCAKCGQTRPVAAFDQRFIGKGTRLTCASCRGVADEGHKWQGAWAQRREAEAQQREAERARAQRNAEWEHAWQVREHARQERETPEDRARYARQGERSEQRWATAEASEDPLGYRVEREMAHLLGTSTEQVIYALVDPRDEQVRYIGRSGEVKHRYRQHCRASTMAQPIPSRLGLLNEETLEAHSYATCAEADAAGEPHTCRYWLHDLHEHALRPTLRILEAVQPPRLVFEREQRWIFHALCTDIPITNGLITATRYHRILLAAIRNLEVDWLTVPLDHPEVQALLKKGYTFPWVNDYAWFTYARTGDATVLHEHGAIAAGQRPSPDAN